MKKWSEEAKKEINRKLVSIKEQSDALQRSLEALDAKRQSLVSKAEATAAEFGRDRHVQRKIYPGTMSLLETINSELFILKGNVEGCADESSEDDEDDEDDGTDGNEGGSEADANVPPVVIEPEKDSENQLTAMAAKQENNTMEEPIVESQTSQLDQVQHHAPTPAPRTTTTTTRPPPPPPTTTTTTPSSAERPNVNVSKIKTSPSYIIQSFDPRPSTVNSLPEEVLPCSALQGSNTQPRSAEPSINDPSDKTRVEAKVKEGPPETKEPPVTKIKSLELVPDKDYEVIVTHVESPWLLWLQPVNTELEDLIDAMGMHYDDSERENELHVDDIVPGMEVCAAFKMNRTWYRARVLSKENSKSKWRFEVFYIDFGNSEWTSVQNIRSLETTFCTIAAHAIPCALNEVGPTLGQDTWPFESSEKLLVTIGRGMGTCQASFRHVPNCPTWFVDLHVEEGCKESPITELLHVNQLMVDQNLAIKMSMEEMADCMSLESMGYIPGKMDPKVIVELLRVQTPKVADTRPLRKARQQAEAPKRQDVWNRFIMHHLDGNRTSKRRRPSGKASSESSGAGDSAKGQTSGQNFDKPPQTQLGKKSERKNSDSTVSSHAFHTSNLNPEPALKSYPSVRLPPAKVKVGKDGKFRFYMAHIESPSQFFVHVIDHEVQRDYQILTHSLSDYSKLQSVQKTFHMPVEVNDTCVCKFDDGKFYRAEILEVISEGSPRQYSVRYVDYGNQEIVQEKDMFPLISKLTHIPKIALCCAVGGLVPIKSETSDGSPPKAGWLKNAKTYFENNTGYKDVHTAYVLPSNTGTPSSASFESPLEVVVVADEGLGLNLNENFVRLGYGRIVDDRVLSPGTISAGQLASGGQSHKAEAPSGGEAKDAMEHWNPMEEDYLSLRNTYDVDTEDAGVALSGYKSVGDSTICKFFASGRQCWKGSNCPYRHVKPGVNMTEKREVVYANDEMNALPVPPVGALLLVEVTSFINPAHFFVNLPHGLEDATMVAEKLKSEASDTPSVLSDFINQMTTFYDESPFNHRDMVVYAAGEMVAAKSQGKWKRAMVLEANPDTKTVKVNFVDFATEQVVREEDTRRLLPRFMHLAFQAVEVHLSMQPKEGADWTKEANAFFEKCVNQQLLMAKVISNTGALTLDVFYLGKSLRDIMAHLDFCRKSDNYVMVSPKDGIKMVPG